MSLKYTNKSSRYLATIVVFVGNVPGPSPRDDHKQHSEGCTVNQCNIPPSKGLSGDGISATVLAVVTLVVMALAAYFSWKALRTTTSQAVRILP